MNAACGRRFALWLGLIGRMFTLMGHLADPRYGNATRAASQ
jgi:hypothetical protein